MDYTVRNLIPENSALRSMLFPLLRPQPCSCMHTSARKCQMAAHIAALATVLVVPDAVHDCACERPICMQLSTQTHQDMMLGCQRNSTSSHLSSIW